MWYQLPPWVWPLMLGCVCTVAVLRGGFEERLAAGTVLVAWFLTLVVFKGRSNETQWLVLIIDVGVFAVYGWIAMRSRRYWPLFTAAFRLLGLVTHVAHALDPGVSGWAYLTAGLIWSYLSLFTVAYAAWTAPRYAEARAEAVAGATRR